MLQLQEDEEPMSHMYMYRFDWPDVTLDGSLQISDKLVVLQFPQKIGSPGCLLEKHFIPFVDFTVCENLLFSYSWLPIYSWADLTKCQDIFIRAYYDYLTIIKSCPPQNTPDFQYFYHEKRTTCQTSEYVIDCKESHLHTSLKIDILPNPTCDILKKEPHVQIHVGEYIVFSSERDIRGVNSKTLAVLLSFILQKLSRL
jgi:hypothetical protein